MPNNNNTSISLYICNIEYMNEFSAQICFRCSSLSLVYQLVLIKMINSEETDQANIIF